MARRGAGEGSVFYDIRRGRWVALVDLGADGAGRRQRVKRTARTKAEVLRMMRDVQWVVSNGDDPRGERRSVSDAVADYIDHGIPARLAPSTRYNRAHFAQMFADGLGRRRLRKLTVRDVEDWLTDRAETWSARTLASVRAEAAAVLIHAARQGWLPPERNVARLAQLPEPGRDRRKRVVLDDAAVRRLLDAAAGDWFWPMLCFVVVTGCRIGEAAGLAWTDVDWEKAVVSIRRAVRCNPVGAISLTAPKAGSTRQVAVPPGLVTVLRSHRAAVVERALGLGQQPPDLAFPTTALTLADPNNLRRWLRQVSRRAGIELQGWHDLRHSLASALADAGVAPVLVAGQLGHATPATTLSVYTHHARPVADAALARGARLFADEAPHGSD